jgi:hypothetical protein
MSKVLSRDTSDNRIKEIIATGVGDVVQAARDIVSEAILGENIDAFSAVYLDPAGLMYKARANGTLDQARVVGVLTEPGVTGQLKQYLVFGRLDNPIFLFPKRDLFLGNNGLIVSTLPLDATHYKPLGQYLKEGSIFINVGVTTIL